MSKEVKINKQTFLHVGHLKFAASALQQKSQFNNTKVTHPLNWTHTSTDPLVFPVCVGGGFLGLYNSSPESALTPLNHVAVLHAALAPMKRNHHPCNKTNKSWLPSVLICSESEFPSSEILLYGVSVLCLSAAAVHLSNWIFPPQNNDPLLHRGPG